MDMGTQRELEKLPVARSTGRLFFGDEFMATPQELQWVKEQLARITYKPGWKFEIDRSLFLTGSAYLTITFKAEDTYHPGTTVDVGGAVPLYMLPHHVGAEDAFLHALARQIHDMEIHESREWLRRDGEIFDNPHRDDPR